jgi:capsular exopolysaccharide synthesis family protein
MIGIGAVFLRAALHRGVRSTDEIESIGLPVYAAIPFSDAQQKLNRKSSDRKSRGASERATLLAVTSDDDLSIEAVRSLRTSMHFAMMESDGNVLMITGPNQEIGKSFVAANLAAVYAQMGQTVLLIDGDMRKGHMQKLFNLEQGNGLSEYLSGQVEKEKVIKHTEIEKLHFISCGEVPPNPSELLMLPNFKELMEWAKESYDLVIIDTPPVLAVTDASVIGRYAGISMLVAWFDVTPVKEIEATMRRCEQNGIQIKGCILNGVVKKAGYGSYGHYGYYDYSCIGNICRSPMGEYLLRKIAHERGSDIDVSSAGISALVGSGADELAVEVMSEIGIDVSAHRARQLNEDLVKNNELILVMEQWQQKKIEQLYPFSHGRVHLLGKWDESEISDPYKMSKTKFIEAYEKIDKSCLQWCEKLC